MIHDSMELTVVVTETTTMTIQLPSFRDYVRRELLRHGQFLLAIMFVMSSLVLFSISPGVGRDLSVSSLDSSYPAYVDRSKTEDHFFAPIPGEANNKNLRKLHLRQRETQSTRIVMAQNPHSYPRSITWNATKEIVLPTDDNTALAIVAMDAATEGFIAERCVRSIRARGEFTGYIMLFTDEQGFAKYQHSLRWDPNTIVIQGLPEDLVPRNEDGTRIKYRRHTMVYKRFKTLPFKYLDMDERFDGIRYVLYLDVDSIVANKLSRFFEDYYNHSSDDYAAAKKILGASGSSFSFWSFWKDPGAKYELWQGGQIMHDRQHSKLCQDAWRDQMDNVWRGMDQPLLMNVQNDYKKYRCVIFELPGDTTHFDLLHTETMENDPKDYPTIVHITSVRVTNYDKEPQQAFIQKALMLDGDEYQQGRSKSMMTDGISWHEVTTPIGAGGIKHTETS
jgi:hypothetical protein